MEGNNNDNDMKKTEAIKTPPPETDVSKTKASSAETEDLTADTNKVTEPVIETNTTAPVIDTPVVKSAVKQYVFAGILIVIMSLVTLYALEQQGRVNTGIFTKINTLVTSEPAVAVVNGVDISRAEYDKNYAQIVASAEQQGLDVTDSEVINNISTQAIDILVNTELLRQAAVKAGVVVTPEQVEARYQEVVSSVGGEEALASRMTELGVTEVALRNDIEGEILIQTFIADSIDTSSVVVNDDDIKTTYDRAVESDLGDSGITIPPLADVRDQIEEQLRLGKEQELLNAFIQNIKNEAEIKILI